MRGPERSTGRLRLLPRALPGNHGLGTDVPVAPSFLALDDEETVAYNARRTPAVSLPALRAECIDEDETAVLALSDEDVEIVPSPKSRAAPSARHGIRPPPLSGAPAPPRSLTRVSLATKGVTRTVPSVPRSRQERVTVSSHAPQSGRRERARPVQQVSLLPKLWLFAILVMVLMVVSTEISIRRNLPWLDCRPYLFKAWQIVSQVISQHIPWEKLPRVPRF